MSCERFEGSGIFSHKRRGYEKLCFTCPLESLWNASNCQVMCWVLTMATKRAPSYWAMPGVSDSYPDPHWMGPAWPKVRLPPRSGLLEKERPGVLAISGHHSLGASWDQMRGLDAPSLIPSFSFTYRGVSQQSWAVGRDRQASRQPQSLKD